MSKKYLYYYAFWSKDQDMGSMSLNVDGWVSDKKVLQMHNGIWSSYKEELSSVPPRIIRKKKDMVMSQE